MEFDIDKDADTPLYIQIRDTIEAAIIAGELKPGDKLPPVSGLARDIGVTQATVRRALQDLTDAGHACCHVGRGTFIQDATKSSEASGTPAADTSFKTSRMASATLREGDTNSLEFAARRLRMGISKALNDIIALASKPGIIHLTKGVPDPSLLPASFLQDATMETFQNSGNELLESTDPLGRYDLRQEIADRFSSTNCQISPDQVLITNGSMQAITLVAQANCEQAQSVLCETPCFKGITDTFAAMGQWVDTVTRDQHGPLPGLPERKAGSNPYLLYLCPYAHNPMGLHLSKERYSMLVEWAKRTGSVVVADEIFRELSFREPPTPSLLCELGAEQTIVVSSLSKALMTGLRLGWLISSVQRVQHLAQLKRLMDQACPSLIQGIGLTLFRSGRFDSHNRKMVEIYSRRKDTMMRALERSMPAEVRWTQPDGGFSLMLELPRGYSSIALFLSAIEKGVAFLPGPLFDIDQRFVHCVRLSYAWTDEALIKEGVELLGGAITELLRRPPGDSGLSGLGSYQ